MIRIHLLGTFQLKIRQNDCTALLSYDKVKLLLAILCLSPNRIISRVQLIELLWADLPLEKGRARLRHALHTLRHAFESAPEFLNFANNAGVSVQSEHLYVDVLDLLNHSSQSLQTNVDELMGLYSGPFLDGIKLPHDEAFTVWYRGWQTRCQSELSAYRTSLINYLLEHKKIDVAIKLTKDWVGQQPEDENNHRLAIRSLMKSGDKEAAVKAYKHCCTMLFETLGTQPGLDVFALLEISSFQPSTPVVSNSGGEKASYRPFATLAIAIAWKPSVTYDLASHTMEESEPEEVLELIREWQEQVRRLAEQHGAWLSQTGGSTVLAHYGYPTFSERPIRHAVTLAQTISQLAPPAEVKIGLAIHADITLVSHAFSLNVNGLLYQNIVPLAWEAEHGQTLLSPQAAARMSAWKINTLGSNKAKRYQLDMYSVPTQPSRIHGRLQEFEFLNQSWIRHQQPSPFFVSLYGLPGLGKNQLAKAMAKFVKNTGGRVIFFSSNANDNRPLQAFYDWLSQQLDESATFAMTKDDLDHICHQLKMVDTALLEQKTGQAFMVNQALTLIKNYKDKSQSLLIIWDGLDEIDSLSLELLKALIKTKKMTKMIIGLSCQPIDTVQPNHKLRLNPLDESISNEYVSIRTRTLKIPLQVKNEIVKKSMGNPLYLEEIIHLYLLGLPIYYIPRIADLILNQLAHVDETTRKLAYLLVSLEKLSITTATHLLETTANNIEQRLNKLASLGLIQINHCKYYVCNDMAKLAIQQTMTREDKQWLYTQIARFFIQSKQPADLIAKQLQQARSPEAAQWWRQAILEALQEGSTQKAADHITEALLSYQYIEDIQLRKQYELEGYFALGSLQISHQGPVSPQTIEAYEKAAHLDSDLPSSDQLPVIWGQWVVTHSSGDLIEGLQLAKKLQKMALSYRQTTWYGWSLYAEAQYYFWKGNPSLAESLLLEATNALLQATKPPPIHSPLGNHSDALAFSALGLAQAVQGRHEAALENASEAIQRAQQSNSMISLTLCHVQLLRIYYLADQLPALHTHSKQLLQKLQTYAPDSIWCAIVSAYVQLCETLLGPVVSNKTHDISLLIPTMEKNLPLGRDAFLCLVARRYIALDDTDQALLVLKQALQLGEQRHSTLVRPEIYCLFGDIWAKKGRPDLARSQWQKAQGYAQQHQLFCYENWVEKRYQEQTAKTENSHQQKLAT